MTSIFRLGTAAATAVRPGTASSHSFRALLARPRTGGATGPPGGPLRPPSAGPRPGTAAVGSAAHSLGPATTTRPGTSSRHGSLVGRLLLEADPSGAQMPRAPTPGQRPASRNGSILGGSGLLDERTPEKRSAGAGGPVSLELPSFAVNVSLQF